MSPDAAPVEQSRRWTAPLPQQPSITWRFTRDDIDPDRKFQQHLSNHWGKNLFIGYATESDLPSVVQARTWQTGELAWTAQFDGGILIRCQEVPNLEVVCNSETELFRIDSSGRMMDYIDHGGYIISVAGLGDDVLILSRAVKGARDYRGHATGVHADPAQLDRRGLGNDRHHGGERGTRRESGIRRLGHRQGRRRGSLHLERIDPGAPPGSPMCC